MVPDWTDRQEAVRHQWRCPAHKYRPVPGSGPGDDKNITCHACGLINDFNIKVTPNSVTNRFKVGAFGEVTVVALLLLMDPEFRFREATIFEPAIRIADRFAVKNLNHGPWSGCV
jgi:hypothetical protein